MRRLRVTPLRIPETRGSDSHTRHIITSVCSPPYTSRWQLIHRFNSSNNHRNKTQIFGALDWKSNALTKDFGKKIFVKCPDDAKLYQLCKHNGKKGRGGWSPPLTSLSWQHLWPSPFLEGKPGQGKGKEGPGAANREAIRAIYHRGREGVLQEAAVISTR